MRYITIALSKGRLAKKALEIFEHIGITCDEMKDENTRKLIFTNEELGLKFFLAKPSDVPTYVEYGAADIGIVGKDTLLEEGRTLYEVYDLKVGNCKMCVCGPSSAKEKLQHHELIRVASKYPNIAKDYFYNKKHQTVEIIKLNGSVELAPIVGLAEVIVDIVETGATLRENGLENLLKRSPNSYGKFESAVADILANVKSRGDDALFEYTRNFDKADINPSNIVVTQEEIDEAYSLVDDKLLDVIRKALVNIRDYHEKQKQYSWFDSKPDGTILGQKVTALSRVGVYVPGGKAAYPSSVLMNVMPAKVAGVEQIVMCTPPDKEGKVYPTTLVAAKEAGVDVIYKVGGAQAIAAMAYGTASVPKVDKIVGPGNIYVALAKKAVFGYVSIDSVAGPSEIMVIADETANPRFVAADLLSQAEHDEMASAILVTTSEELAKKVSAQIDEFLKELSRSEIISKSLENYGYILVADSIDEAIEVANDIASEHLEIVTKDPFNVMTKIKNAGAIFLGEYSSEPLGDYFAGPNHVLPTNGTAKFFSPLSVDDFIKKSSIISYSREALELIHNDIETFAKAEHLTAHANSIHVRFEGDK